jgi:membrane protein
MADLRWFWHLLQQAFVELKKNDPLRLSSSTAFFAMFSLIPTIVLILDSVGMAFQVEPLKSEIFSALQNMFGEQTSNYLADILSNVQNIQDGFLTTIAILLFLIFIVTTLFNVVHNSFNQILQIKVKDPNLKFFLKSRGLFLVIIFFGGILFLTTFVVDLIIGFAGNQIFQLSNVNSMIVSVLDTIISMGIFAIWLAIIYKYLPDIKLPWRPVWVGSSITTILAYTGQFLMGKFMATENLDTIYGSSASMILVLLFIFYASFLLYYGICLIKIYAERRGCGVESVK